MKVIAAALRGFLSRQRSFLFYLAIVAVIAVAVYAFSSASFQKVEELYSYRLAINSVYEQWLILRTDALNYLKSDKQINIKAKLETSLGRFEDRFLFLSRTEFDRLRRESPEIAEKGADILQDWQASRRNLLEILSTGAEFDSFSRQIYWLTNDTVGFDANLKELLLWFDGYSRRQFLFFWRLFFFMVVTIVLSLLLAGRFIRGYLRATRERQKPSGCWTARFPGGRTSG